MADSITCPFCDLECQSAYQGQLHIEEAHTENSPFVPQHDHSSISKSCRGVNKAPPSPSPYTNPAAMPGTWTRCTRPNCGEWILLSDADEHLEIHAAIAQADQQDDKKASPLPPRRRARSPVQRPMGSSSSKRSPVADHRKLIKRGTRFQIDGDTGILLLNWLAGSSRIGRPSPPTTSNIHRLRPTRDPGRLGKRELGPYAFEERMPESVQRHLEEAAMPRTVQRIGRDGKLVREDDVENETAGLISVLADLCALDEDNETTYLCHPCVRHVRKLYCDGNFCGYWNIQVLLTYIQHMDPDGPQTLPNVLKLQKLIERAWDQGICAYSRVETGGIKGSRKWIGTQEALAFFTKIGVKVDPLSIIDGPEGSERFASDDLLDYVEAYFLSGTETAKIHGTSFTTQLAPIYFQRLGHSMAIVGLERRVDGSRNLLVFDSSFATSEAMKRLLTGRKAMSQIPNLLKPYRKTESSLTHWREFELIVYVRRRIRSSERKALT